MFNNLKDLNMQRIDPLWYYQVHRHRFFLHFNVIVEFSNHLTL